jgi:hypothetical protein
MARENYLFGLFGACMLSVSMLIAAASNAGSGSVMTKAWADGSWWITQNPESKRAFLEGIVQGAELVNSDSSLRPSQVDIGAIVADINNVYRAQADRPIPVVEIYRVIVNEYRNGSADSVEDSPMTDLRRKYCASPQPNKAP